MPRDLPCLVFFSGPGRLKWRASFAIDGARWLATLVEFPLRGANGAIDESLILLDQGIEELVEC